ncbi:sugar phosphate isomerase/epimerase family protein [Longispora albida]|uniref:sugar phosphate isomerase/epimerase family protein n=1 Tax=Longispora albida TaxID=203523 RepID=UPI0003800383|nr:sugar phosphate isomerase/epimerase family protein [Longispora albida]
MRLAFSTLGCTGLALPLVATLARMTGWTGVELRTASDEPVHIGLSARERSRARQQLARVEALCLASYVRVAAPGDDAACVAEALEHARLASDLGIPAVRVFTGADRPGTEADERAARRLELIAAELPEGVNVWLETHDSHPRGADITRVLDRVGSSRVRAIWDVLHPWLAGEEPQETLASLRPYLAHVQLKDVAGPAVLSPLPLGAGVVPLTTVLDLLTADGYTGWLSLEWERKWHPEAAPLAEALSASRTWLATVLR